MVGSTPVFAEVASTSAQRDRGLMFRTSLPLDHGMLFVFRRASSVCFWMKNTPVPLSVAFIGSDGRVLRVDEMQPETFDLHCPPEPVHFALEMPFGWFLRHASVHALVTGLPSSFSSSFASDRVARFLSRAWRALAR